MWSGTDLVAYIEKYKTENPGMFSWEIRERLVKERVCDTANVPSVTTISRVLRGVLGKGKDCLGGGEEGETGRQERLEEETIDVVGEDRDAEEDRDGEYSYLLKWAPLNRITLSQTNYLILLRG